MQFNNNSHQHTWCTNKHIQFIVKCPQSLTLLKLPSVTIVMSPQEVINNDRWPIPQNDSKKVTV
jgi:hypothetical protein